MCFSVRYVSPCTIYFICQKSSRFLLIFFSVIEDTVRIEIMKYKIQVTVLVLEKTSIYYSVELFSLREISHVCARARPRAHLHALMTPKTCAVGLRNVILSNHLRRAVGKYRPSVFLYDQDQDFCMIKTSVHVLAVCLWCLVNNISFFRTELVQRANQAKISYSDFFFLLVLDGASSRIVLHDHS